MPAPAWLARLRRPRGGFLLRRVVVELRGIRKALERQADALERQAGAPIPEGKSSFRSFARTREEMTERDLKGLTEVAYVDERQLAELLDREAELKALLGRDPTEVELERAFRGEIE